MIASMGTVVGGKRGSKRAKASEAARLAKGYRVVRVFLPPAAAAALDSLTKRDGTTMTEAIERALLAAQLDSLLVERQREAEERANRYSEAHAEAAMHGLRANMEALALTKEQVADAINKATVERMAALDKLRKLDQSSQEG